VVFVFTHDSIGLGEDGPTHQPVEQAATLRLIPNMDVWRPCDTTETMAGWIAGIERRDGPVSLLLTRQNVPFQKRTAEQVAAIERGAYVLSDASGVARAVVIATGSEVALAIEAQKMLANENIPVRVVSMPSTSVFDRQDAAYRESVLPRGVPRIAVEAGVSDYWRKYVGLEGAVVGIDRYGESAPAADVFKFFGFTAENVVKTVKQVL
jgi:transketolase